MVDRLILLQKSITLSFDKRIGYYKLYNNYFNVDYIEEQVPFRRTHIYKQWFSELYEHRINDWGNDAVTK